MAPPRQLGCLVCIPDPRRKGAMLGVLDASGAFKVLGTAADAQQLISLRAATAPDFVILDEKLPGLDERPTRDLLEKSAPIPTLLFVDAASLSSYATTKEKRWGVTRVNRKILDRTDEFSRAHLSARLELLASKCMQIRRARTPRTLEAEVKWVREKLLRGNLRKELADFVATPIDLILLAGGAVAGDLLASVVARVRTLPVPVLVSVPGKEALATDLRSQLLESSVLIPGVQGYVVAQPGPSVQVRGSVLYVDNDQVFSSAKLVESMASLGPCGLTVLLPGATNGELRGLVEVSRAGGLVATLNKPSPQAAEVLSHLPFLPEPIELSPDELTSLLVNVVPRAV